LTAGPHTSSAARLQQTAELVEAAEPAGGARSYLADAALETAITRTPRLAVPLELLRQPGLTGGQRETRHLIASRIEDLRYALDEPGGQVAGAARALLDAMAEADDADARATRGDNR
jgi:hypothetical protein